MPVTDYSTTPASNTSISGINIGEGMTAANVNNAMRQMMADIRVFYNGVPVGTNYMLKTGGAFTGDITRDGRGGYFHNANPADLGGKVTRQPIGGALPASPNEGDWLVEY